MAADAGEPLAGHGGEPASHDLYGLAFGVERLEGDRGVCGDFEDCGAVIEDGDGSEDSVDVPGCFDSDVYVATGSWISEVEFVEAEVLYGSARYASEAGAGVDIGKVDGGVGSFEGDLVGNNRRGRCFFQRYRFEEDVAGGLFYECYVVEDVNEVEAPEGLGGRFCGDEEVFVAEGVGVEELGP